MEKQGGNLSRAFKNGETIVLENFFNEATNYNRTFLFFRLNMENCWLKFDAQGKVIDYTGLNHVSQI